MKRNVEDPEPAGVQAVFIAGRFPPRAKMMPAGRQQPSAFDAARPETARQTRPSAGSMRLDRSQALRARSTRSRIERDRGSVAGHVAHRRAGKIRRRSLDLRSGVSFRALVAGHHVTEGDTSVRAHRARRDHRKAERKNEHSGHSVLPGGFRSLPWTGSGVSGRSVGPSPPDQESLLALTGMASQLRAKPPCRAPLCADARNGPGRDRGPAPHVPFR